MSPSHVLFGGTWVSLRAVTCRGATPGSAPNLETQQDSLNMWPLFLDTSSGQASPHPTLSGDGCGREAGREPTSTQSPVRSRNSPTRVHISLCRRGPGPGAAISQQGPCLPGAQSGLEGERVKQEVKEKRPGQGAELVGAPSPYAKVMGSIPGQGTCRSQPVSAPMDGAAS